MVGKLSERVGALVGKALVSMHIDSWEAGFEIQSAVSYICWSFFERRLHTNFGALELGKPEEVADAELNHPNLQFRFLRLNYLIRPSPETKGPLDYFIEGRSRAHFGPHVIYERPPATNSPGSKAPDRGDVKN